MSASSGERRKVGKMEDVWKRRWKVWCGCSEILVLVGGVEVAELAESQLARVEERRGEKEK